jgi:Protein of unknown function (DUF3426)
VASRPVLIVATAVAVAGLGAWFYLYKSAPASAQDAVLTPEGKAYVENLRLTDVGMKATDSYAGQTVVEIEGKIANAGSRALEMVEIYCVFQDPDGQLILRRRLAIVSSKMGGLKPGESKSFRLPFDDIPASWNQAIPRLVIASVKFS